MNYRIMVVEDSKLMFAEMERFLAGSDIEIVQYCRSGEEALEMYGETAPDLVTMDIIMPGMDGVEAAVQLLTKWPDAKVIMISSLAYDDTIHMVSEIGVKGFLFKPFDEKGLVDAVHTALQ